MAEAIPLISQPIHNNTHSNTHSGTFTLLQSPRQLRMGLLQSKTSYTSTHSEAQSMDTIDSRQSLDTIESDVSDSDSSSGTSTSSDWDARTVISTVSTVLRHKKHNNTIDLKPIHSQLVMEELEDELQDPDAINTNQRDLTYDLYSLFYPYTNLQSLLYSQLHPYIESDYKNIKNNNNEQIEDIKYDEERDKNMDWNDVESVIRIQGLITKLLSSSSLTTGIKEENIYLMFSSPSPFDIIQHLRFGPLSHLCEVHVDRFGRRSYHYRRCRESRKSQLHFYNHSRVPSSMFGDADVVGLSDFIEEDTMSEMSDVDSVHSIAKIHYHDNDVVMITSPRHRNGKTETQIQWQNYAIHSYLYRRTRITADSISNRATTPRTPTPVVLKKQFSNSRHMVRFGVSVTPKMYGSQQQKNVFKAPETKPITKTKTKRTNTRSRSSKNVVFDTNTINTHNRKHARDISAFLEKAQKEGFLEKQKTRSVSNIMNISRQWTKFWCVLWNTKLLIYGKSPKSPKTNKMKNELQRNTLEPVQCIDLGEITLPIFKSYDQTYRYYIFRLNHINGRNHYVFRTKSEFQRKSWVSNIELMLNNDNNFVDTKQRRTQNQKTASCLVM